MSRNKYWERTRHSNLSPDHLTAELAAFSSCRNSFMSPLFTASKTVEEIWSTHPGCHFNGSWDPFPSRKLLAPPFLLSFCTSGPSFLSWRLAPGLRLQPRMLSMEESVGPQERPEVELSTLTEDRAGKPPLRDGRWQDNFLRAQAPKTVALAGALTIRRSWIPCVGAYFLSSALRDQGSHS